MRVQRSVIAPEPFDMFARASRWPSRQHPRRDDEGHDGGGEGGANANDDAADTGKDAGEGDKKPGESQDKDWKAEYEKTLAHARKHETRAKENAAAAKELADLKKSQMTEVEKANTERDELAQRLADAEARSVRSDAARKYSLTDEDLELLDGVPADKFDARAKALSERIKAAAPAGKSGLPAGGEKEKRTPTTLASSIAAHYGT
ncbi:hypothetical protein G9444_2515 [Rhodococcus erythropolis]|uniref:Scaffolding protein n=1 Tax=Rhodococcus erythropolis TaxID=1833 RepID=A0A6G9CS97_RHOER|nr:hypothetical protein [Rhodococcus erythropolis]QIP39759.1 hypothetical protein G9444_2515 [Rhodococcus erythropolis]